MRYQGPNVRWAITLFVALLLAIAVAGVVVGLVRRSATELLVGLAWGGLTVWPSFRIWRRYVAPAVTFTGDRIEVEGTWGGSYAFAVRDLVRVRRYVNRGGLQYRVLLRGERRRRTLPVTAVHPDVERELLRRVARRTDVELDRRTQAKVDALRRR